MKKKKNRLLLFLWSLIPGAGDMYLGFMKTGVSLMSAFAIVVMAASYTGLGILAIAGVVVGMYSFFHANNLGSLNDEEFARMEDAYLFGINEEDMNPIKEFLFGKYRKVFAAILLLFGISMVWQVVCDALYDILGKKFYNAYIYGFERFINNNVPTLIIGIVIIWLGIKLIQGKKIELDRQEAKEEHEMLEDMKMSEEMNAEDLNR